MIRKAKGGKVKGYWQRRLRGSCTSLTRTLLLSQIRVEMGLSRVLWLCDGYFEEDAYTCIAMHGALFQLGPGQGTCDDTHDHAILEKNPVICNIIIELHV